MSGAGATSHGTPSDPALAATHHGAAFAITDTVPWGRDAAEYTAFFRLSDLGPECRILDCGGGPSSFTAEMVGQGRSVVAVDPLYRFDGPSIERRVAETADIMREGLSAAHERFVWDRYGSPDALVSRRLATMRVFLADYEAGGSVGRYVNAALPLLPFPGRSFDLVLCSHLLFLYDHRLDRAFHEAALLEMLRVGREARVFPLLDLSGQPSKLVVGVGERLLGMGFHVDVEQVGYEFQKGGDRMLRILRP